MRECLPSPQKGHATSRMFAIKWVTRWLFGPETRGLPQEIRDQFEPNVLRIPLRADSRSLNLGNAVAIALFEAWRQVGFINAI